MFGKDVMDNVVVPSTGDVVLLWLTKTRMQLKASNRIALNIEA